MARDPEFAVGIQALNAKTLGGYPAGENDIEREGTLTDPGKYANLPAALNKDQSFRGSTAWPTKFGSVLQAYCRDRGHDRIVANWGHEKYLAPAFHDGGVIGSKIALFACPAAQALAAIGQIEVAEGLPHPLIDGVWAKIAPAANASYLIVDFGENNIDQAIAMTKRAGLGYLYHSSPFATWGHFKLKPNLFPHGWDGLRTCVEKARRRRSRRHAHALELPYAQRSVCDAEAGPPLGARRRRSAGLGRGRRCQGDSDREPGVLSEAHRHEHGCPGRRIDPL